MRKKRVLENQIGQAAVELAVFGAIVVFVIGLILKTSLSISHQANIQLRAFRRALQESYLTANGKYAGQFSAARNQSSILIMEDRLSIDPSQKQGTRDRFPVIAQGSGTMTHSLFMDVDPSDAYDQSIFDVVINGQRFPFTTSGYRTLDLDQERADGKIPDCNANGYGINTGRCYNGTEYVFFRKADNGEDGAWCVNACSPFSADSRFDLDFNGTTDVASTDTLPVQGGEIDLRDNFGWQWVPVQQSELTKNARVDIDGDFKMETIISCSSMNACQVLDYQAGDMDSTIDDATELQYEAWRLDQIADGNPDPGPLRLPGLDNDMRVYSYTKDGTLLQNIEGKLFTVDGQFVRNETKQDHLDIIERVFYLSNATDRFCSNPTTPRNWKVEENWAKLNGVYGMVNPVERCGNCFSVENEKYTCMDVSGPTIFVRSRIRDRRRVRWVTRTEDRD
ncbi:MAG TPA: hypothetical protein VLJ10_00285 [Candidatus Bathyarchaeia archaeon]|nr:hypothetical protein [Candidatus Bathyarchaeia archaeon]